MSQGRDETRTAAALQSAAGVTPPPAADRTASAIFRTDPTAFVQALTELIERHYPGFLSRYASPACCAAPGDVVAPSGWQFRPGEFCLDAGDWHPLRGRQLQLLEALARAGCAMRFTHLRMEVWDDRLIDPSTVRSALTDLRVTLRRCFRLPRSCNPVPAVDAGNETRLAWRIATDVIRSAIRRRRRH